MQDIEYHLRDEVNITSAFKHDHKKIITLYDEILASAKEKNFSFISRFLEEFSSLCSYHFYHEGLFIYDFLNQNQPFVKEKEVCFFNQQCVGLQDISIDLFEVISKSSNVPVNDHTVDHFINDFEKIGETLKGRIACEEKILFPLYEKLISVTNESS